MRIGISTSVVQRGQTGIAQYVQALLKALSLSAKLTVPLILFIFPALLGALMLPAAARLIRVFGNGTPGN